MASQKSQMTYSDMDSRLVNILKELPVDYWDFKDSDTREMTHGIHSYPAMMIYPISRNIISIVSNLYKPTALLDPFCGSGTVPVEAELAGIPAVYGNDINPLAKFLATAKTTPIDITVLTAAVADLSADLDGVYEKFGTVISEANAYFENVLGLDLTAKDGWAVSADTYLSAYLETKNLSLSVPSFKNLGYWFKPSVVIELQILKDAIKKVKNEDVQRYFWIAFSEAIRLVSNRRNGEFKMFRMTPEKVRKFNPSVRKEFFDILSRNVEKMASFIDALDTAPQKSVITILDDNAMDLSHVPDNSIDLLITSPPYGDSRTTVAYGEFSRLSLQWLDMYELSERDIMGIDKSLMGGRKYRNGFEYLLPSNTLRTSLERIMSVDVERAGDVYSFYADLDAVIAACARKSKPGSYQFWVVGNRTVKNENLQTDVIISEMAKAYGLSYVHTIDRNISNKVMPSKNSPSNVPGATVTTMCNEHIVVLRKD